MPERYVHMKLDARMAADNTAEISIYGYITSYKWDDSDVTALDVKKELDKVKDAKKLKVHINSPGGSLYQGEAIMDNLTAHKATEKEGYIEGLCASAATLPLLPMTRVFAYDGSEVMIHNPSSWGWGTAKDLKKAADSLLVSQKSICRLYAKRFKKTEEEIQAAMDDETWLDAQGALDFGIVDEVLPVVDESGSAAAAMVSKSQMQMLGYKKTPEALMNRLPEKEMEKGTPSASFVGTSLTEGGLENTSSAAAAAPSPQGEGKEHETAAVAVISDKSQKGENKPMTMEELRKQHPELVTEIQNNASAAERQRMQDIDDVTLPGYESMAAEAKYSKPVDAAKFNMEQTKAMKAKGTTFMQTRTEETAKMQGVLPSTPPETTAQQQAQAQEQKEMAEKSKECAAFAPNKSTIQVGK